MSGIKSELLNQLTGAHFFFTNCEGGFFPLDHRENAVIGKFIQLTNILAQGRKLHSLANLDATRTWPKFAGHQLKQRGLACAIGT